MTTDAMFQNLRARTILHFRNIPPEWVDEQVLLDILPVLFHKLKNKLTPIMGYAQILKASSRDAFFSSRLEKIEENASDLSELLNTLKDYFQFAKKPKQKTNLNRALKQMKGLFGRIEKELGVCIRLKLDPKVPDDLFSPGEIEALILNLVDNALTAVKIKDPAARNIWIRTAVEGEQYRLHVRDDGIGIGEEEQGKIWAPFFSRFPERPGLGLTVCEKIVSGRNGQFQVQSEPGVFSEFTATFPRSEISEAPKRNRDRSVKK